MGSIKNVVSEPIEGHEDYHMMVSNVSTLIISSELLRANVQEEGFQTRASLGLIAIPASCVVECQNVNIVCCQNVNILGGVLDICYSVELWADLTRVVVPFNILHLVTVTAV